MLIFGDLLGLYVLGLACVNVIRELVFEIGFISAAVHCTVNKISVIA